MPRCLVHDHAQSTNQRSQSDNDSPLHYTFSNSSIRRYARRLIRTMAAATTTAAMTASQLRLVSPMRSSARAMRPAMTGCGERREPHRSRQMRFVPQRILSGSSACARKNSRTLIWHPLERSSSPKRVSPCRQWFKRCCNCYLLARSRRTSAIASTGSALPSRRSLSSWRRSIRNWRSDWERELTAGSIAFE
jgi:hypothetical protein